MAVTNTNAAYLTIDGQEASGLWTELKLNPKRGTTTGTRGSNVDWEGTLPTLWKITGDLTITYDAGGPVPQVVQDMRDNDTVTIVYGPEGNTSGLPKHEQSFVCTGIDWGQMTDKGNMLVFKCSLESDGAPTSDMFSGDTFA